MQGIFHSFKGPVANVKIVALSCLALIAWLSFVLLLLLLFQVDLLLGKAYSEWGRVSDAVSVYNQLISTYPDDFRGYLAKVLSIWSIFYRDGYLHFFA